MISQKKPLEIFQVELTNFCDMSCSYCPHTSMQRPKGHMTVDILEKCINHAKNRGKERLMVHHFGEPLLHPELEERFKQLKQANLFIQFSTNGTLLQKHLPMMISLDTRMDITLSVHQWTSQPVLAYWNALDSFQKQVQNTKIHIQRAYNVNMQRYFFCSWVNGRVRDWDFVNECYFLRENSAVVLWNGDLVSCCVDCHGESIFSNITTLTSDRSTLPWSGCPSCDLGHRSRL